MGQKACVASELIYDDCFVPDDCVCLSQEGSPRSEWT